MASFVPRRPPLVVPIVLLVAATIILGVAFVLLSRIERFAFGTFWMVYRWALLAYVISAGMIAYAFIRNHTPGGPLTVTLLMLVIFALSVPMTIAFTVARFQDA
jgi:drug/metabolite transporter (DMT)-like permease